MTLLAVLGLDSGQNITGGISNVAVGKNALESCTTDSNNVCIGYDSGNDATAGGLILLGAYAGDGISTGDYNICIGYDSGSYNQVITTGEQNICLGAFSHPSAADASNQIMLGYNCTGAGNSTFRVLAASGVFNSNNTSSWNTTSDARIKKNIGDATLGLDALNSVQVRQFEYREKEEIEIELDEKLPTGKLITGVIAQEIENVIPETVSTRDNGLLTVKTDAVLWTAVKAIQELSDKVDELTEKLNNCNCE